MLHGNYRDVEDEKFSDYGSVGSSIRWLISKNKGAPNFAMRVLTVEEGGHIGLHEHPNEHEIFILSGKCRVETKDETVELSEGDYILVPEKHGLHGFRNIGTGTLQFICCVPNPK